MDDQVINLNVGGVPYAVTRRVLIKDSKSRLYEWFKTTNAVDEQLTAPLPIDSRGAHFVDRDGILFRYVLDYLRNDRLMLPDNFDEHKRLISEAQYYKLSNLVDLLVSGIAAASLTTVAQGEKTNVADAARTQPCGYITVGYQGTFSFGPQGLPAADVNFRKINRILVSGRVSLCREVFGETLNEGRDPDRGHSNDRYTARFYLKHNVLEQAFDMLAEANFKLAGSCASGTTGNAEPKPGSNTEEDRWAHYSEFVFCRHSTSS